MTFICTPNNIISQVSVISNNMAIEFQFEHSKSVAVSPSVNSKPPNPTSPPPSLPCRIHDQNFKVTCFFQEYLAILDNAFIPMFSFCYYRYLSGGTFGSMAHLSQNMYPYLILVHCLVALIIHRKLHSRMQQVCGNRFQGFLLIKLHQQMLESNFFFLTVFSILMLYSLPCSLG